MSAPNVVEVAEAWAADKKVNTAARFLAESLLLEVKLWRGAKDATLPPLWSYLPTHGIVRRTFFRRYVVSAATGAVRLEEAERDAEAGRGLRVVYRPTWRECIDIAEKWISGDAAGLKFDQGLEIK